MRTSKNLVRSKHLKYVLILLIFLTLQNTNLLVNAQTIVLDNSENSFSGYIFWPEFLQDCGKDSYMDTGGELQDIQADIIFNFDTGKITGTISAKQVDEKFPDVYKEDSSVQGTINGIMEKKNDYGSAGYWQWVFSGEVDFTIHYHMEHKCSDDTGGYWETEDQTLTKKGVLTGQTWGELWSLDLRWEDQETRDGRTRYVQLSPDNSISQIAFPNPIDLEVTITMPPEVDLNSDSTPFKLNVEGSDVNMIDHFEWYFAYWEPDLERYWGLQNEQNFETRGQATLEVTDAMRDEWKRVANEYGFESEGGAEIDLQINLRTFDVDGNDLVENVAFNYTYVTSSDTSSGTESTGGEIDTPSSTIPSTTEPSITTPVLPPDSGSLTSFFGGTRGLLVVGGVAAAGFGLTWLLRRRSLSDAAKRVLKSSPTGTSDPMPEIKPYHNLPPDPNAEIKPQPLYVNQPEIPPDIKPSDNLPPDPNTEIKPQPLYVNPPDLPEIKPSDGTVGLDPNPEIKLGGGSEPPEITEMIIDDKQFSNEVWINIEPSVLDGTVDTSNLSMDKKETDKSLTPDSRVKADLESLPQEDTVSVEDDMLRLEGNRGSNEDNLNSLNLQPSSEIDTEINKVQLEPSLNIAPNRFDGTVEKGTIPSEDNEITLNSGSQEKVDLDNLPLEDSGSMKDTSLRLEGDANTETKEISKSEIKGNFRLTLGTRMEDTGSFAASSDSQIDIKKDAKSDVQTQKKEAQDRDTKKTDDPNTES